MVFRQQSPFPQAVTKTTWQLLYTQRTWRPSINLDVKLLPYHFSLKQDQWCHSTAISFCLLYLSFIPSPLCPSAAGLCSLCPKIVQAWQPLDISHHRQFTEWDYFKCCILIFVSRCSSLCHRWKKNSSPSHQVINVFTVLCCRTPTTQLYLAVMYHWYRSMASGWITRICAPLSLTSGCCGVPQRPPASEKLTACWWRG